VGYPAKPRAPVSVKTGGREARLFWFGAAADTAGVIQVNAFVPEDIGSGPQPIELTIGANVLSCVQCCSRG